MFPSRYRLVLTGYSRRSALSARPLQHDGQSSSTLFQARERGRQFRREPRRPSSRGAKQDFRIRLCRPDQPATRESLRRVFHSRPHVRYHSNIEEEVQNQAEYLSPCAVSGKMSWPSGGISIDSNMVLGGPRSSSAT